ncbi:SET domain-containing protein [Haematococcus lacustris]|uniref:SET domain-containing protein n=1 Tax=Haematococcus lacustris TaxID=44745 RepID=A0A699ZAP4_HAELA|nr:SET domain-containing protein [Haematococcus lacustris]
MISSAFHTPLSHQGDQVVRRILEYQSYLGAVLEGHVNLQLEFTIKEMLGSANVTLDDLKYGCAVGQRYILA